MVEPECWPGMEPPETRYVAVGEADVAYQVVGDVPVDLLYCWGLGSHIELSWDSPGWAVLLPRLASFSRLIFFDRRGTMVLVAPSYSLWKVGNIPTSQVFRSRSDGLSHCHNIEPPVS